VQAPFRERIDAYRERVEACLGRTIPAADSTPRRLHAAMRYAVLDGGKRVRPLLVYASGECLGIETDKLDAPAVAIELIHAFSLIHDDLPAMDDDDLRRGRPTVHREFDEATAILAGDALLPLAFGVIAGSPALGDRHKAALSGLIASASGSLGMTGGQAIDLASEGKRLTVDELKLMHDLKTGALIHASVMAACCVDDALPDAARAALDEFGRTVGLAFQIRDDLLDVEGETETIGKAAGADQLHDKATWPSLFGLEESRARCDELLESSHRVLEHFGARAEPLHWLADYIVARAN
jgi:farnesyl diphosphate synthase